MVRTETTDESRYYFQATDGSQVGPFSLEMVLSLLQAGKVRAETPVSNDGQEFKPMKAFAEFATLLAGDLLKASRFSGDEPSSEEGTQVTYSGHLNEISFIKVFYHLVAAKTTGRARMTRENSWKEIKLIHGMPVSLRSSRVEDGLLAYLTRRGLLTQDIVSKLPIKGKGSDKWMADVLQREGLFNPHELYEHIRANFLDGLFELFAWRSGSYAVIEGPATSGSILPLNLNPWEIISKGVRTGYQSAELLDLFSPMMHRALLPKNNPHLHLSQLGLESTELNVFRSLNHHPTLLNLLETLGGNEASDRVVLVMIYMGLELDLVEMSPLAASDELIKPEDLASPPSAAADSEPLFEFDQPPTGSNDSALIAGDLGTTLELEVPPELIETTAENELGSSEAWRQEELQLDKDLKKFQAQDHFERLGLSRQATSSEVAKAFIKAARVYHPDQAPAQASPRMRKLSSEIFAMLSESHGVLSNDASRLSYFKALGQGFEEDKVDVGPIVLSEELFQKAESLMKAGKYGPALEQLQQAVKLNKTEGEFWIHLGYAQFMSQSAPQAEERERCIQLILKGLKMRDNKVPNGYFFLGSIHKSAGDMQGAERMFRKTLSLQNNHVDAARELRLMAMRGQKPTKKK